MKVNLLTDKGQEYLNAAFAGTEPVELLEISIGDGLVSSTSEAKGLTDLKSKRMTFGIDTITTENGINTISTIINNINLASGFRISELGVYAQKSDGSKILFWYINYDQESSWLQEIGKGLIRSDAKIRLVVNAENQQVVNVSTIDIFATKDYVDGKENTIMNTVFHPSNKPTTSDIEYKERNLGSGTHSDLLLDVDTFLCDCTTGDVVIASIATNSVKGKSVRFKKIDSSDNKVILRNSNNGGFFDSPYLDDLELRYKNSEITYTND